MSWSQKRRVMALPARPGGVGGHGETQTRPATASVKPVRCMASLTISTTCVSGWIAEQPLCRFVQRRACAWLASSAKITSPGFRGFGTAGEGRVSLGSCGVANGKFPSPGRGRTRRWESRARHPFRGGLAGSLLPFVRVGIFRGSGRRQGWGVTHRLRVNSRAGSRPPKR